MRFELFVAFRYLLAKRKQAVVSVVTLIAVLGVAAGVMALTIALALSSGMQNEFRSRILGATAHINLLRKDSRVLPDYEALLERLSETQEVSAASCHDLWPGSPVEQSAPGVGRDQRYGSENQRV